MTKFLTGILTAVIIVFILLVLTNKCAGLSWQIFQPGKNNNASSYVFPAQYPRASGATEIWNWGNATGNYTSEIQADSYIAGSGGTPGHLYTQAGPPGTIMNSVFWRNDGSFNSHHTAPGTAGGQSSGPVNANMQPGTSSFKFYFLMKSVSLPVDQFYYFFDYDLQVDGATFTPGIQIFVSTAGLFAPCSLIVLMRDGAAQFGQYHAKTNSNRLCGDNAWHMVEMIFDKTQALPEFKIDDDPLVEVNTFAGPALSAIGTIAPTNGIRFGMREYSETATGRANLQMAAAAYAKSLTYVWK